MPERQKDPAAQLERIISSHEGTNSRAVPWLLSEVQNAHAENVITEDVGVVSQRLGTRAFGGLAPSGTTDADPGGLSFFEDEDFSQFLVSANGHHLYRSSGSGAWARVASSVSLAPGLLHQFERARHNGELAFAVATCEEPTDSALGRSDLVIYSIISDVATQASLAPRCVAQFQNRLFYGEGEVFGWSEIGDLVSYSDTNQLLIEPGVGGDEITFISPSRDTDPNLWIFKKEAIFLFTPRWGTDDAIIPGAGDALNTITSSVRTLSRNAGCIATRSAVWVPGEQGADLFFLDRVGVRALSRAEQDVQTGAGFPVSYNIPAWIDRINFSQAHKAAAMVEENSYYLSVPLDGALDNTHLLRYDIAHKAWSLHSLEAKDLVTARLGGRARLFMQNNFASIDSSVTGAAGDPAFQVFRVFESSVDPSTSVTHPVLPTAQWESRSFTLQDPKTRKKWDRATLQMSSAETSRVNISYRRDLGVWTTVTEFLLEGTAETAVLAVDSLPWVGSDDETRNRSFGFSDVQPSKSMQIRVGGVTGATEAGRLSLYLTELQGVLAPDEFYNEI